MPLNLVSSTAWAFSAPSHLETMVLWAEMWVHYILGGVSKSLLGCGDGISIDGCCSIVKFAGRGISTV